MAVTRNRQGWGPSSLLNRQSGYAATDCQIALGVSPIGRVAELERRVAELERHLVLYHRHYQGIMLEASSASGIPARISADGWNAMSSPNGTITISRGNTMPHRVDLDVTTPGCPNAVSAICCDDDGTVDAVGCDTVAVIGEDSDDYLRAYTHSDDGNKVVGIEIEIEPTVDADPGAWVNTHTGLIRGLDNNSYEILMRQVGPIADPTFTAGCS